MKDTAGNHAASFCDGVILQKGSFPKIAFLHHLPQANQSSDSCDSWYFWQDADVSYDGTFLWDGNISCLISYVKTIPRFRILQQTFEYK